MEVHASSYMHYIINSVNYMLYIPPNPIRPVVITNSLCCTLECKVKIHGEIFWILSINLNIEHNKKDKSVL